MARTFTDVPAERRDIPLLIGLMGPSSGGKTYSALRLAKGIQQVAGGEIFVVDTESGRAKHYADSFAFRHIGFGEPFGSLDYLDALKHCVKRGAGVTIVDSLSHEHIGPGGYLMTQEAELQRMAGDDHAKRERMKMAAWIKPAGLRQQFIAGLLQLNSNFIFCFRAKEKVKPIRGDDGKTKPTEQGFQPQASEDALYEMTVNCVLMPGAKGVPTWRSPIPAEQAWMKCPGQLRDIFADGRPLDEDAGRRLAEWARGTPASKTPAAGATPDPSTPAAPANLDALMIAGDDAASRGKAELHEWWTTKITAANRKALGTPRLDKWKEAAIEIDRQATAMEAEAGAA